MILLLSQIFVVLLCSTAVIVSALAGDYIFAVINVGCVVLNAYFIYKKSK